MALASVGNTVEAQTCNASDPLQLWTATAEGRLSVTLSSRRRRSSSGSDSSNKTTTTTSGGGITSSDAFGDGPVWCLNDRADVQSGQVELWARRLYPSLTHSIRVAIALFNPSDGPLDGAALAASCVELDSLAPAVLTDAWTKDTVQRHALGDVVVEATVPARGVVVVVVEQP